MKIVTANVPKSQLYRINRLIGEHGLYLSRSELVRIALRDFLLKELKRAKKLELKELEPKIIKRLN